MKNKLTYIILSAVLCAGAVSCEKTTEGLTGLTYYPTFTINGTDGVIYIGETYDDPGCTAVMNGEDVTDMIEVSDNIDNQTVGVYNITYSIVNEQGFTGTATRTVYVVNENSVANIYKSVFYGAYDCGIIEITENSDGSYHINDMLGGYYCNYKYPGYDAYGYDFYLEADITIDDEGNITRISDEDYWFFIDPNDPCTMENGIYDAESGELYWEICFSGAPWSFVTLYPFTK